MIKTAYYEIDYDKPKNRVLWTMIGFWKSMDIVPDYFKDWASTLSGIPTGFSILCDLTEMKPWPEDVFRANMEQQAKCMKRGCGAVAICVSNTVTKLQLQRVVRESGMESVVQIFETVNAGKTWLNSLT